MGMSSLVVVLGLVAEIHMLDLKIHALYKRKIALGRIGQYVGAQQAKVARMTSPEQRGVMRLLTFKGTPDGKDPEFVNHTFRQMSDAQVRAAIASRKIASYPEFKRPSDMAAFAKANGMNLDDLPDPNRYRPEEKNFKDREFHVRAFKTHPEKDGKSASGIYVLGDKDSLKSSSPAEINNIRADAKLVPTWKEWEGDATLKKYSACTDLEKEAIRNHLAESEGFGEKSAGYRNEVKKFIEKYPHIMMDPGLSFDPEEILSPEEQGTIFLHQAVVRDPNGQFRYRKIEAGHEATDEHGKPLGAGEIYTSKAAMEAIVNTYLREVKIIETEIDQELEVLKATRSALVSAKDEFQKYVTEGVKNTFKNNYA